MNLESISDQTVTVTCNGNLLETLTLNKAYEEVHAGAVLLHQGETYISEELDLNQLVAKVRQENVNYYTEALKDVDVAIKKTFEEKQSGVKIGLGELAITEIYHTYLTKTYDEVIKRKPLEFASFVFLNSRHVVFNSRQKSEKKLKLKDLILLEDFMRLNMR